VVSLDPAVGSEMQKPRPAVVVSPDEMNNRLDTVLATLRDLFEE
jgi:mRNA-degrading endonuclease toxin of MazEF toxin-antitoxin module